MTLLGGAATPWPPLRTQQPGHVAANIVREKLGWVVPQNLKKELGAMENIDRRTVFAAGLAAASLISNTSASAQQPAGGSAEARLRELGIELPKVPVPVANYVPAARLGNVIFLAGTGPIKPDGKLATGKVGIDVTRDEANQHARLVGVGLLAVMRQELGSLDKVVRVGRVFGMVNAAPDFTDHPKVINGCSDLFVQVFGDRGRHARCAVGMNGFVALQYDR
jgi:enamine deaminase RidA (YjgF/YER057c/UK114 family)